MAKKTSNLHLAKAAKKDEFYTRLITIENELRYYKEHFKGKVILCPCDESEHTNFYKHFMLNIEEYGWKKLVCIGYRENRPAEVHIVTVDENGNEIEENITLMGNGDFRNEETQKFFDECDIVATNPPFSLFREFVDLIMTKGKKFLIIGNQNALTYKEFFPLIQENKVWVGYGFNKTEEFKVSEGYKFERTGYDENGQLANYGKVPAICWFTNLSIPKREVILDTGIDFEYGLKKGWYQKYDNYDAINVDKISQIPMDYDGIMGVPITFIDKHNPNQFEILGMTQRGCHNRVPDTKKYDNYLEMKPNGTPTGSKGGKTNENGNLTTNDGKKNYFIDTATGHIVQSTYQRIFIRRIDK